MNALLQYLTTHAPAIIDGLSRFELRVAVLALLVLGIDLVLRRATPRFRYALWLVALAGTLWPPSLALSALDIWGRQPAIVETFASVVLAPVATVNVAAEPGITINWATLALLLWAVMSASILILMTVNFVRFRLRLRPPHAQPWPYDEKVTATGQPWPPIWATGRIHSPLTAGLLRPRIYLT